MEWSVIDDENSSKIQFTVFALISFYESNNYLRRDIYISSTLLPSKIFREANVMMAKRRQIYKCNMH